MFVGKSGAYDGSYAAGGKKKPDQHIPQELSFVFIAHGSGFGSWPG